jgi:hypothetical protein
MADSGSSRTHASRFVPALCAAAVLMLGGCGDAGSATGGAVGGAATPPAAHDPKREMAVAADKDATAKQIIDAGGPVRVAVSGDQRLVAWTAESDDDEGPQQAAWRLYDEHGGRIADGRLGQVSEASAIPTLTAVPDGFLLANYTGHVLRHIAVDGAITDVPSSRERPPTQAGDVLQESLETAGSMFYRPGDHTAYRLPKLPFRNPQGVGLDARGRVWVLVDWSRTAADVASSAGGSGPWQHTTVALPRGGAPAGLTVAAGQVLVPTVTGDIEHPKLAGLWRHQVAGDPGAAWSPVPTTGVTFKETLQPLVDALPDGRVVLTGDSGEVWVQDGDGSFVRSPHPSGTSGLVQVAGSHLFLSFTRDHQLYASDDGRSWKLVDR